MSCSGSSSQGYRRDAALTGPSWIYLSLKHVVVQSYNAWSLFDSPNRILVCFLAPFQTVTIHVCCISRRRHECQFMTMSLVESLNERPSHSLSQASVRRLKQAGSPARSHIMNTISLTDCKSVSAPGNLRQSADSVAGSGGGAVSAIHPEVVSLHSHCKQVRMKGLLLKRSPTSRRREHPTRENTKGL